MESMVDTIVAGADDRAELEEEDMISEIAGMVQLMRMKSERELVFENHDISQSIKNGYFTTMN